MKNSLPAAFSFLVPGMGQLIKKHFLKATIIWLVISLFAYMWSLGFSIYGVHMEMIHFFLFLFPLWAWNVYDAYNSQPKAATT